MAHVDDERHGTTQWSSYSTKLRSVLSDASLVSSARMKARTETLCCAIEHDGRSSPDDLDRLRDAQTHNGCCPQLRFGFPAVKHSACPGSNSATW
jgi:hypothetical protein